jgi:hypothetical protein
MSTRNRISAGGRAAAAIANPKPGAHTISPRIASRHALPASIATASVSGPSGKYEPARVAAAASGAPADANTNYIVFPPRQWGIKWSRFLIINYCFLFPNPYF